jgi:hypothetical protein
VKDVLVVDVRLIFGIATYKACLSHQIFSIEQRREADSVLCPRFRVEIGRIEHGKFTRSSR